MKARITIPGTAGSAKLTVVSCATLMVLVSAAVSACTGPSSSSVPAIFSSPGTGTHTGTATGTATATSPESGHTATGTATGTPTNTATSTPTPTTTSPTAQPPTPTTTTYYPTAAPQTGGGGTAGLQNGLAIGIGGTAIVAGLGGLAYRRKLTRRR